MKTKPLTIGVLMTTFTVFILGATFTERDVDKEKLISAYETYIVSSADSCKFNTGMRYSRSRAIRNAATVSCLKNTYFTNHKAELIKEMTDRKIGTQPYKIKVFLNKRFYDYARSRGLDLNADHPLSALPTHPPDWVLNMKIDRFCRYYSIPPHFMVEKLKMSYMLTDDIDPAKNLALVNIAAISGDTAREVYLSLR